MNTQDIVWTVVTHLLTQNEAALDDMLQCMYRVPGTELRCAVGCLISDDVYTELIEQQNVQDTEVIRAVEKSIRRSLTLHEVKILGDLQAIHDTEGPQAWPRQLRSLLQRKNIAFPQILIDAYTA